MKAAGPISVVGSCPRMISSYQRRIWLYRAAPAWSAWPSQAGVATTAFHTSSEPAMADAVYSPMYPASPAGQPGQLAAAPLAEQEAPAGRAVLLLDIEGPVGIGQAAAQLVAHGLAL